MKRACAWQQRIGAVALLSVVATAAWTQPYPHRPIRFVVGFAPGGIADLIARALGQQLTAALGQPVIIDNRAGAGGTLSMQIVSQAPPDGYTLLMGSSTQFAITPALRSALPYDPIRNYSPITHVALTPVICVAHPALTAKTLKDLTQYARVKPGHALTYGSPGYGGAPHIAGEWFRRIARLDMTHVPYKGGPLVATALLAGELDLAFGAVSTYLPHFKTGRLRPLGVTSATRLTSIPDVPTFIESGLTGFDIVQWYGVFGPAGLSAPLTRRLNETLARAIESSSLKTQFSAQGAEFSSSSAPEFAAYVRTELGRWTKVLKEIGITDPP